jgi:hypothetical protein
VRFVPWAAGALVLPAHEIPGNRRVSIEQSLIYDMFHPLSSDVEIMINTPSIMEGVFITINPTTTA